MVHSEEICLALVDEVMVTEQADFFFLFAYHFMLRKWLTRMIRGIHQKWLPPPCRHEVFLH